MNKQLDEQAQIYSEIPFKNRQKPPTDSKIKVCSQFHTKYAEKMLKYKKDISKTYFDFDSQEIVYHSGRWTAFQLELVDHSPKYQVVRVKAEIGEFTIYCKIINIAQPSSLARWFNSKQGSYGRVYCLNYRDQQIAIKQYKFSNVKQEQFSNFIRQSIREFCISKICSVLQAGPAMPNPFGFDLLIFEDTIQSAVEACQEMKSRTIQQLVEMYGTLARLHHFKIMHLDIKLENIMFSRTYNKMVFIDFGFSTIVKEVQGYKTLTSFKGTPNFVSPQMMEIYFNTSQAQVDLYFNDLYALNSSIQYVTRTIEMMNGLCPQFSHQIDSDFLNQADSIQIKRANYIKKLQFLEISEDIYLLVKFKHICYFKRQEIVEYLIQHGNQLIINYRPELSFYLCRFFEMIIFGTLLEQLKNKVDSQLFNFIKDNNHRFGLKKIIRFLTEEQCQEYESQPDSKTGLILRHQIQAMSHPKSMSMDQTIDAIDTLSLPKYQKREDYAILFEALRFDKKKFNISKKRQVAQIYLRSIRPQHDFSQTNDQLMSIKLVFKDFFGRFVQRQLCNQIDLYDLLCQVVLLEVQIQQQLSLLIKRVTQKEEYFSFEQCIDLFFSFFFLFQMFSIKHRFSDATYHRRIQSQRSQLEKALFLKMVSFRHERRRQQKLIVELFGFWKSLLTDCEIHQSQFLLRIQNISSIKIKFYFLEIFCLLMKYRNPTDGKEYTNNYYKFLRNLFNSQIFVKKHNFFKLLYWKRYQFFLNSSFILQATHLQEQVRRVINYDPIYSGLIIKFSHQNLVKLYQQKKIDELTEWFGEICRIFLRSDTFLIFPGDLQMLLNFTIKYLLDKDQYRTIISSLLQACLRFNLNGCLEMEEKNKSANPSDELDHKAQKKLNELFELEYFRLRIIIYVFMVLAGKNSSKYTEIYERALTQKFMKIQQSEQIHKNKRLLEIQYYTIMFKKQSIQQRYIQALELNQKLLILWDSYSSFQQKAEALLWHYMLLMRLNRDINPILLDIWKSYRRSKALILHFGYSQLRDEIICNLLSQSYLFQEYFSGEFSFKNILYEMFSTIYKQSYYKNTQIMAKVLCHFASRHTQFFNHPFLGSYLSPFNETNYYQLIFYFLALRGEKDQTTKLQICYTIAKNIDLFDLQTKIDILGLYFGSQLQLLYKKNDRKYTAIIMKNFLKCQQVCRVMFRQKVKKSQSKPRKSFVNLFKNKISRFINIGKLDPKDNNK